MESLKNLPIRFKMLSLLMLPLILAAIFIAQSVLESYKVYDSTLKADALGKLSVSGSFLVHELQKERGASAVYLGSEGQEFSSELKQQKENTNKALLEFEQKLQGFDSVSYGDGINTKLNNISRDLDRIKNMRQQITDLNIKSSSAIGFYTNMNEKILALSSLLANIVDDPEVIKKSSAYYYFLESKERAGIERAVLSNVFAKDAFDIESKKKYISLVTSQDLYIDVFKDYASVDGRDLLDNTLVGPSVDKVKRYRQIADKQNAGFNVDASDWFVAATGRINLLKEIEKALAERLILSINNKQRNAYHSLIFLLGIALVALLITLLFGQYILSLINKQLGSISQAMQAVSLHSDLTVRSEELSRDELGTLALHFNTMLHNLNQLVERINKTSLHLLDSSGNMQAVSANVSEEVRSGLGQTDTIVASVHEMSCSIQEVAQNCSSAADQSNTTLKSAQSGQALVGSANEVMQKLTVDIDQAVIVIRQVAEHSNDIGDILDVIKGIAEQTNLLALNAAIEAARAGEMGRGFAVVADEVRNLAHKTQESIGRIEDMIEQLQFRSNKAVNVMEQSHSLTGQASESFGAVLSHLSGINDQAEKVNDMNLLNATATEEQSSTTDEINRNIQDIQQRYHRTNGNVVELGKTSSTLKELAASLSEEVQKFKL